LQEPAPNFVRYRARETRQTLTILQSRWRHALGYKIYFSRTRPEGHRSSGRRTLVSFADFSFHGRVGVAAGSRLCLARSHIICSSSRLAEIAPSAELHNMGVRMTRHVIWAEDEKFTGWCCSQCLWGIVAPRLESTVAALALTARRKSALTNTPAHGTFNKRRGLGLGAQMMEYSRRSVPYRDIYGRLYIRTSI
jgi:hypothetical protein